MKKRQKVSCRVSSMDGSNHYTEGERTVFGLVITPWLNQDNEFSSSGGWAITDPVSGLRAASGWTKLDALNDLKVKARKQREIFGSFIGALDSFRRNAIVLIESGFYERQAARHD